MKITISMPLLLSIEIRVNKLIKYFLCLFGCVPVFSVEYGNRNLSSTKVVIDLVKPFLPDNPTIVEAGAYDADDSILLASGWPNGSIHIFEPVPELYEKIIKKITVYKNIYSYNLALSDSNGVSKFYISENINDPGQPTASSSLLEPKEHLNYVPYILFKKEISVPTITLDSWAKKNGIKNVDFLWLDIQGYEFKVLKSSGWILKTVKAFVIEVEFVEAYKNQALFYEIHSWAKDQGFTLVSRNFEFNWWCGDALYVRKELLS